MRTTSGLLLGGLLAVGVVAALLALPLTMSQGAAWAWLGTAGGLLAGISAGLLYRMRTRRILDVLDRRHRTLLAKVEASEAAARQQEKTVDEVRRAVREASESARLGTEALRGELLGVDRRSAQSAEDLEENLHRRLDVAERGSNARLDMLREELRAEAAAFQEQGDAHLAELEAKHQKLFGSVTRFRETYQGARAELQTAQRSLRNDLGATQKRVQRVESRILSLAVVHALGLPAQSAVDELPYRGLLLAALKAELKAPPYDRALALAGQAAELLGELGLGELRILAKEARSTGLLRLAIQVQEVIADASARGSDARALSHWQDELRVDSMDFWDLVPEGVEPLGSQTEVVLHLVGKALPETQSGYTVRTHETVKAQLALGMQPVVAVQGGVRAEDAAEDYELDGIRYITLEAPARNRVARTDWLRANINSLVNVCQELRPRVLHAHSDYLNAMIAEPVGKALGIPVVYEQRGFWEESWWSRLVGDDAERSDIFERLMMPEAYTGRQRQEAQARAKATRLVTLAEVMVEHAKDQNDRFGWGMPAVDVVQNAVDVDQFAQVRRRPELATELGIAGPVVGYVSSMVAYEGIDVLVDGFLQLRNLLRESKGQTDEQLAQTLVRDWAMGDSADALLQHVRQLASGPEPELLLVGDGIAVQRLDDGVRLDPGIHLVGRVPKDEVLDYYGLIDVFVVPRKPFAVSELVTPLKPFEAMAAGRALIMSDVRALREIAQESGASLLFEPGNATDLAAQLARLLADEDQRESLGRKGREWVSKARTWEENAWAYAALYSELGMQFTPSLWAVGRRHLKPLGLSATPLLRGLQEAETPRAGGWFDASEQTQSAAEIMEDGWLAPGVGRLEWQGFNWDEACKDHRSAAFHLHSWDLIQPAMREWFETRDEALLDWMLMVAQSWRAHVLAGPAEGSMAWYDMALAGRLGRLGRLVCWAVQCGREAQGLALVPLLLEHVHRLLEPGAFNPRNNHGFFAAAAGLDYHRLFGSVLDTERVHAISDERMRTMVEAQFAPDGGHREHSPAYHGFLLGSFQAAVREGLIDDPALVEVLRRAEHALGWFVQPDGLLAQFGDTDAVAVNQAMLAEVTDEATLFQISRGEKGCSTTDELFVLPEAGYAMVRSPQPQNAQAMGTESYLAVLASFHSRAHKHADDLTVVWTHKGHEVLVDSGRFGYLELLPADSPDRLKGFYYSRPERQYVESTRAHNTVEVDGRDIERRKRSPYGSGILQVSRLSDGSFCLDAEAPHDTYVHRRRLHFHPGHSLILEDELGFSGDHEQITVWFNIDGSLDIVEAPGHLDIIVPSSGEILRMTSSAESLDVVRGQQNPLRGWRSRRDRTLEPVWSLALRVPVTGTSRSVTTEFRVVDREGE